MDFLMSIDRREDNYFSYLQRAAVDLYWGLPGSTCFGDMMLHCASFTGLVKPALCSALASGGGR